MTSPNLADDHAVVERQKEYYRRRAPEYDDWFYRRGRYDHGPATNERWRGEVATVERAIKARGRLGAVLELAAGTGIWTERLVEQADSVTAVDAAHEVLDINRSKLSGRSADVRFVLADIFSWQPDRRYDTVFFGFWLSHVPESRFEEFWALVRKSLAPNGSAFFVDSLAAETSGAVNHVPPDIAAGRARRQLADGSEYEIVKLFWTPDSLQPRLESLGWQATVKGTDTYFIYGEATPSPV